jgi:prepilin-type processing-associated H-X9-DG protein
MAVAVAMLVLHSAAASPAAMDRAHPFLLVTTADVERARDGMKRRAVFADLAKELTARATTNRVEDLPALERDWWQGAKQKPWSDIYPEVFHHTWIVPMKWAELARNCARANLVSPSQQLAAKGRRVLLLLSDYTFEFEHFDVGMNYTIWTLAALDTYDILYAGFTTEERARVDAFFGRYLAAVRKSDDYWIEHEPGGRLNNHYAWHKLGLGMMGVFYGRPELVERALRGPKGVEQMLAQGFKDDGLWLEGSIPYQFAETAPLVIMAQMLENARYPENLFRYRSPNGHSLKQAYGALIPLLFPDRTLPTIGDCYGRRAHIAESPDWEILFRQFHALSYAWLIADRRSRTPQALFNGLIDLPPSPPPRQQSRLWPEMGYLALRSNEGTNYWSGRGWSLFATFSGQPVHEHADKLSHILFADGHLWLPDSEAKPSAEHAFSSVTQVELNRETICHNTLLVDGRSQRLSGQRLDLLEFTNAPGLKRATIGDLHGRLYEGVRQLRTLIVSEGWVLDFFQAASAAPHEFAWLTHVDGKPAGGSLHVTNAVTWPSGAPWSYLREPRGASATGQVWECFSDGEHTFRMDVLTDGPAEVVHCGFPRDDSPASRTLPMRLIKRRGTNAWFLAAYRIVARPGEAAELSVMPVGAEETDIALRMEDKVFRYRLRKL